jgi:ABC-2 type transport system ATP-binding protein
MQPPISVEHLTRSYGQRRGVSDLTFRVEPGEVFGFLGPNGAGKSTTIRLLMGLIRPDSGSARIFGHDCWSESPSVKANVGFLPAEGHLPDQMTGAEMLDFYGAFRGTNPVRRRELMERFEVDSRPKIGHLSTGNRQKLAVVQALMHDAPLLILDEPSSGLDPLKQAEFLHVLREERERGRTIFLSSHVLHEVEQIADRVAIIRDGEIVAIERVEQLARTRERRMEVTLSEPVPEERFAGIDGVRLIETRQDEHVVELGVRGNPLELLRLMTELPVEDFTYGPPDLESVFLQYYSATTEHGMKETALG